MKTSVLIGRLQKIMGTYGDIPVMVHVSPNTSKPYGEALDVAAFPSADVGTRIWISSEEAE